MGLNVSFDASRLERWASELSARGFRNAIRRAIDQSARAARKQTIPVIAADIGVPQGRVKEALPRVRSTKQGDLSASWEIKKLRIGIANTSGAKVMRYGGLTASTHRLTGGGSASLNVKRAFVVRSNGGTFVAYRRGKGKLPLKAIYAASPHTTMGQDSAAANKHWRKIAGDEVNKRLRVEISKQLVAEGLSASTTDSVD